MSIKRKIRNWFQSMIFECMSQVIKDEPLIISNRAPTEKDNIYGIGTRWNDTTKNKLYTVTEVEITWKEIKEMEQ
jgi:hypothetical protein